MANLVTERVSDSFVILLHNKDTPTDADWDHYMEVVKSVPFDKLHKIVLTPGGGPSPKQRKIVNDFLAGRNFRAAIVTQHAAIRAIVTLMSWFNRELKGFAPADIEQAIVHARVTAEERSALVGNLRKHAKALSSPPLDAVIDVVASRLGETRAAG